MEIADLRTFLVVARLANLRAAAEVLHQTPSALSKSVKRLEESLGTALFDRVGKSLRLNAEGDRLAARALELVALADATAAEFPSRPALPGGRPAHPECPLWPGPGSTAGRSTTGSDDRFLVSIRGCRAHGARTQRGGPGAGHRCRTGACCAGWRPCRTAGSGAHAIGRWRKSRLGWACTRAHGRGVAA